LTLSGKDFTYDGEGPATHFYMDTAVEPTANGLILLDSKGGSVSSCGMVPLLAADGTDVYRAEFPNGTSIQDFLGGSFSVWCTAATANFGEVVIPSTIPGSLTTVDDSALLICSDPKLQETEPYLIGNLTTRAHNVTGTVYLISDHIIEIKVF
jgi:Electron transfer DM13